MASSSLPAPPLVAVLRGISPPEVEAVSGAIAAAGIVMCEVTMDSPAALESIAILAGRPELLVGAGTVLTVDQVDAAADAGAKFLLAPNFNPKVVARTKERGLIAGPGVMTPTEAFSACACGADWLKIFPGEVLKPAAITSMRAVLGHERTLVVTGGITAANFSSYLAAGASGVGFGSALYKAGKSVAQLAQDAAQIVAVWRRASAP